MSRRHELVRFLFRSPGWSPRVAAILALASLVLSDLAMPCVDGRKVARAVKHASHASPETPIGLVTGVRRSLVTDGEVPECVGHLTREPLKLSELRQALARYVRPLPA